MHMHFHSKCGFFSDFQFQKLLVADFLPPWAPGGFAGKLKETQIHNSPGVGWNLVCSEASVREAWERRASAGACACGQLGPTTARSDLGLGNPRAQDCCEPSGRSKPHGCPSVMHLLDARDLELRVFCLGFKSCLCLGPKGRSRQVEGGRGGQSL